MAGFAQLGVVAQERPVAAGHRQVLLMEALAHVDPVRDAVAVGQHQGGPRIGFGFAQGQEGLLRIGAHGHLCHVHIAVRNRLKRQVFLAHALAGGGKFGRRRRRRSFRHLAAGVGVHLRVEHQHVHVAAAGQGVVEPPRANVVGPTVAAHQPHTAAHQVVGQGEQVVGQRIFHF